MFSAIGHFTYLNAWISFLFFILKNCVIEQDNEERYSILEQTNFLEDKPKLILLSQAFKLFFIL